MKNILITGLVFFFNFTASAQKVFVEDANATQRSLNGSFNAIQISGGIDLYLSPFNTESIAVSASDQKTAAGIITQVQNNTLNIYYDGYRRGGGDNKKMKVYVAFKALQKLKVAGACQVQVAGTIAVPALNMELSGASNFKGAVKTSELVLELSGASDIIMNGSANAVMIHSSGASDFKGFELVATSCAAQASGASDINITVTGELTASASGASNISYKGNGTIKSQRSSGASSIERKSN